MAFFDKNKLRLIFQLLTYLKGEKGQNAHALDKSPEIRLKSLPVARNVSYQYDSNSF